MRTKYNKDRYVTTKPVITKPDVKSRQDGKVVNQNKTRMVVAIKHSCVKRNAY